MRGKPGSKSPGVCCVCRTDMTLVRPRRLLPIHSQMKGKRKEGKEIKEQRRELQRGEGDARLRSECRCSCASPSASPAPILYPLRALHATRCRLLRTRYSRSCRIASRAARVMTASNSRAAAVRAKRGHSNLLASFISLIGFLWRNVRQTFR